VDSPHIFLPQNLEAFFLVMKGEECHWYLGMDEATIEERLRLYGSKTRCFCPSESKATRIKASLSSPSERNRARSAFLTVFSPYSLRQVMAPAVSDGEDV